MIPPGTRSPSVLIHDRISGCLGLLETSLALLLLELSHPAILHGQRETGIPGKSRKIPCAEWKMGLSWVWEGKWKMENGKRKMENGAELGVGKDEWKMEKAELGAGARG